MSYELVIEGRFADPLDGIHEGFLGIEGGRIAYITERPVSGRRVISLSKSEIVLPGFIDTHVHFREPGWEHKGDMGSESRAAALGGVTTAMEMPNTPVQTVSRERVLEKKGIAEKRAVIDMEFFGGVGPGNLYTLEGMADVVPGFKIFMCESTGNLRLDSLEQVEEAFSCLSGLGKPVKVHCEDEGMNRESAGNYRNRFGEHGPLVHALARPPESEVRAIGDVLGFSRKHGVPVSVCHVSTMEGMKLVKGDGKARAEATIHHSLLDHGDLRRLGPLGKMNPPLRNRQDRDYVMESVIRGDVPFIVTDHAPHTLEEKRAGDFWNAPSGVPTVEHYGNFAALLLARGMGPKELARATSYNATQFFKLEGKGRIEEGCLADLVILDTRRPVRVGPPYQAKCGWSPLEGMEFPGGPSYTIRRGRVIVEGGRLLV
jgi:dihydroorotase